MTAFTQDITGVTVVRHGVLRLEFADGVVGDVDVLDRMRGPVFSMARTPDGFAQVSVIPNSARSCGRTAPISRPTRSISEFGPDVGRITALPPDSGRGQPQPAEWFRADHVVQSLQRADERQRASIETIAKGPLVACR